MFASTQQIKKPASVIRTNGVHNSDEIRLLFVKIQGTQSTKNEWHLLGSQKMSILHLLFDEKQYYFVSTPDYVKIATANIPGKPNFVSLASDESQREFIRMVQSINYSRITDHSITVGVFFQVTKKPELYVAGAVGRLGLLLDIKKVKYSMVSNLGEERIQFDVSETKKVLGIVLMLLGVKQAASLSKPMSFDKEKRLTIHQDGSVSNILAYSWGGLKRSEQTGATKVTLIWDGSEYLGTKS